jgi:hypothetical protein
MLRRTIGAIRQERKIAPMVSDEVSDGNEKGMHVLRIGRHLR